MRRRLIATSLVLAISTAQAQAPMTALIVADDATVYIGSTASPCPGKACTVYPLNTAACTARLMGGTGVNAQVGGGLSGAWMSWWCPSTRGPQLRVLVGTWTGTLAAVECINKSGKTPAQALPGCAPDNPTSAALLPIWRGSISQILSSKP